MTSLVEELESIGAALEATDPGDAAALGRLLTRRGEILNQLAAAVEQGVPSTLPLAELLERLTAISFGAATPYRSVLLDRLLTRQQLVHLSQQKALVAALSDGTVQPSSGRLVRTTG